MAARPISPDVFSRLGDILRDEWPHALTGVGALALAAAGLLDGARRWWLLSGAGVVAIVGAYAARDRDREVTRLKERFAALERELAEAKGDAVSQAERRLRVIKGLGRTELAILNNRLDHWSNERWSLFLKVSNGFRLIARASKRPSWQEEPARLYPEGQGCLWWAWEHGEDIEGELPDPKSEFDEWCRYQSDRWHIGRERAEGMRMRSRTYAGFRVASPDGSPLGVVILESESLASVLTESSRGPQEVKLAVTVVEEQFRLAAVLGEAQQVLSSTITGGR